MITEFLDKHGVEWSKTDKHSRHGWCQLRECPRCFNQNFHCGIKETLDRSSCYTCGSWYLPKLLRAATGASWQEINALLGNRAFIRPDADDKPLGVYTPPTNIVPIRQCDAVHAYVLERGLDPDYLESVWGARATGPFSNYPFRLFIPIYKGKKAVSWTARAACGQEPRYQTASAMQKSFDEKKLLFGNQFIREAAIIVEGPLSAIRLGKGSVATMGLAYTQQQVNLVADIWRRVIVFDNEPKAQARARQLADQLAVFPGETFVVNLDAPDPAEATRSEIRQLRDFAFGKGK
jgi:hypothetical protein